MGIAAILPSVNANLAEITRMVLIHQDSVVVLATGITSTTRVSSVLTNTTVTSTNVSSLLSVVVQSGWLIKQIQSIYNAAKNDTRQINHAKNEERINDTKFPSRQHNQILTMFDDVSTSE